MLTHRDHRTASARRRLPLAAALVCASALMACAPRRAEPPARPPAPAPAVTAIPEGARVFDIDPQRTVVTFRVYRAGPLAKLGHNHVITSGQATGFAWQGREPADSGFEIRIPVNSLVVDAAAARAAAGPDFEGTVPDSAREGTHQNLLRPEVLDGARFAEVIVRSNSLSGTWERPVAMADITLKGVTRRKEVPIEIGSVAGALTARGSFTLRQTDFGMTPFSAAGGAIQVADEIGVSFEIVAVAR